MQEIVYKLVPGLQERKYSSAMYIFEQLMMKSRENCVGNLVAPFYQADATRGVKTKTVFNG